jgi:hypothetical protein
MDRDDPEKRIAELERQSGEARAAADAQRFAAWRPVSYPWQGSQQDFLAGAVVGPQARGARSRRPGLGTIVGASLGSLFLIAFGAWMSWDSHSGVPARIEVVECQSAGKSVNCTGLWPPGGAPEQMIPIADGKWTDVGRDIDIVHDGHPVRVTVVECHVDGESLGCTGVSPPSAVPLQTIRVAGAGRSDVGHDIDVHVHQGRVTSVTADNDQTPYLMIATGCVAAVFAVIAFVRRLRHPGVERQLAFDRGADLTHSRAGLNVVAMPVSGQQTAPGCFVASAPRLKMKWAALLVYGGMVAIFGLLITLIAVSPGLAATAFTWMHVLPFILGIPLLLLVPLLRRSRRWRSFITLRWPTEVSLRLIGDGLEVNRGRGRREVFPVIGATLGPWAAAGRPMGTALHLRNGRHRFVLGGRNHRVPMGVRLDAKPMSNVDAWMRTADFDALLRIFYR